MRTRVLAVVLGIAACRTSPVDLPITEEPMGGLQLTLVTTGVPVAEHLTFRLDGLPPAEVDANGVITRALRVGTHVVQVDVPGSCRANRYAPDTIEITAGTTLPLTRSIHCANATPPGLYFTHSPSQVEEHAWRANLDGSNPVALGLPGRQQYAVMNPARTRLAWIQTALGPGRFTLWISDPTGANAVNTGWIPHTISWSPDGRRLLIAASGVLAIVWPDGIVERKLREGVIRSGDWSPDGRYVAYEEGEYHYVMDLETGTRTNTLNLTGGAVHWSPDGTRLGFIAHGVPLRIMTMRVDGSDLRELYRGDLIGDIDWGSDGMIRFGASNIPSSFPGTAIYRIPGDGGTPVEILTRFDLADYREPRWAP
jgi:Tol biopolymer transport system component